MREIKFRGKRVDNGEWIYGYLFEHITTKIHICYIIEGGFVPALSMPSSNFKEVIPETVGQYIGIKDKKGVEIYHKDICKIYFDVDKVEDYIYLSLTDQEKKTGTRIFEVDNLLFNNQPEFAVDKIEVIGNIYDNPKLLEGNND